MLTWTQLGLSRKPIGMLNVNGFYDNLLAQFDTMAEEGFLKKENRQMLVDDPNPTNLISKMLNYTPIETPKWLQSDQT